MCIARGSHCASTYNLAAAAASIPHSDHDERPYVNCNNHTRADCNRCATHSDAWYSACGDQHYVDDDCGL